MKNILNRILVITYSFISLFIMSITIVSPFIMAFDEPKFPIWAYVVLYFLCIIIIASQSAALKWADKVMKEDK